MVLAASRRYCPWWSSPSSPSPTGAGRATCPRTSRMERLAVRQLPRRPCPAGLRLDPAAVPVPSRGLPRAHAPAPTHRDVRTARARSRRAGYPPAAVGPASPRPTRRANPVLPPRAPDRQPAHRPGPQPRRPGRPVLHPALHRHDHQPGPAPPGPRALPRRRLPVRLGHHRTRPRPAGARPCQSASCWAWPSPGTPCSPSCCALAPSPRSPSLPTSSAQAESSCITAVTSPNSCSPSPSSLPGAPQTCTAGDGPFRGSPPVSRTVSGNRWSYGRPHQRTTMPMRGQSRCRQRGGGSPVNSRYWWQRIRSHRFG